MPSISDIVIADIDYNYVESSTAVGAYIALNGDTIRITTQRTITTSTDTGLTGEITWDLDYVYICVNTNTWHRSPHSSW